MISNRDTAKKMNEAWALFVLSVLLLLLLTKCWIFMKKIPEACVQSGFGDALTSSRRIDLEYSSVITDEPYYGSILCTFNRLGNR